MCNLKEYKLDDVFEIIKDSYHPNNDESLNYIGLEHIEQETLRLNSIGKSTDVTSNKYRFLPNDILFGKLRCYFRKVVKPNFEGICSTDIWVCRAKENFDQNFLFYFLANRDFINTADNGEGGTRMPRADWDFLKNTIWNFPDKKNQISIASILSSLDEKIDLLHRQNKTLEQLIDTLFKQAFVVYSNDLKKGVLGSLVETTIGGEWGKENPEVDFTFQVQCIRGTDIADLQTGLATRIPTRFVKEKKYNSIEPIEGDLIMEISGGSDDQSTGRTIYINDQVKQLFDSPLVFSNFCRLIRCKKKEYMFYLYSYIQMLYNQGDFFNLENGSSGIRNFDYKAFLFELEYDIHNTVAILKFNSLVQPYFEKINQNKKQIRLLTQYRDMLLPKLLNGEITINNAN